jgi:hypothetical protein
LSLSLALALALALALLCAYFSVTLTAVVIVADFCVVFRQAYTQLLQCAGIKPAT